MLWPQSFDAPPEGGHGWVVVAASFAAHVITMGLQYSFGVLYNALMLDASLEGTRASLSLVGAMSTAVCLGGGILVGRLVNAHGHRACAYGGAVLVSTGVFLSSLVTNQAQLYATFGVIAGLGMAFSFQPAVMIVSRYFVKRRALATGIAVSGSGFGTLIFGQVSAFAIDAVGWRRYLQIWSLAALVILLVAASTFSPVATAAPAPPAGVEPPGEEGQGRIVADVVDDKPKSGAPALQLHGVVSVDVAPAVAWPEPDEAVPRAQAASKASSYDREVILQRSAGSAPMTMLQVWRDPAFLPMAGVLCVYGGGLFTVYPHLVIAAIDIGLTADNAARLVSLVGLAGTIGRIVFGRITDDKRTDRVLLFQTSLMLAGSVVIMLAFLGPGSPWWGATSQLPLAARDGVLSTIALLFGLFSGAIVSQVPVIFVDFVGLSNLPHAMGGGWAVQAPAVLVAPTLAGAARAAQGNYFAVFLVTGLALTLSPLLLRLMPGRTARRAEGRCYSRPSPPAP
jgi:MFS family permease